MSRYITRRDLLTRWAPGVAASAAASSIPASKVYGAGGPVVFAHGVASGDPTQERLIIWSRITTNQQTIAVNWELSGNENFNDPVRSGVFITSADRDYTIKVDVDNLQAGTEYYYRFSVNDIFSNTGRAQTLPVGDVTSFNMGVCSCSNYPAGYFNAYAAMAERDDLDVVLHLGDYIYEYDAQGYASQGAEALGRVSDPLREVTTLADFRRRHAQYKSDKDLQRLHAKFAFILSWDDHEFANDSWHSGAENVNPGEGSFEDRKAAALQAYYEWMPIRTVADQPLTNRWRSFEIGELASLILLETRISARDQQVDLNENMVYVSAKFDLSDPENPVMVSGDHVVQDEGKVIEVDLPHDVRNEEPKAINDYAVIQQMQSNGELPEGYAYMPDMQKFRAEVLDDPQRQLLGEKQRKFVAKSLSDSRRKGKKWQLVANQTLVANVELPNLADQLSEQEKEQLNDWVKPGLPLTRLGVPFGTDSWNGYGAERESFLRTAAAADANLIVLTGDTHAAWGIDLQAQDNKQWQGIELGATSISSPGLPEELGITANRLSELLLDTNGNLNYSETAHHGYLSLQLTSQAAHAEFHRVSTVTDKNYTSAGSDKFLIKDHSQIGGLDMTPA